MSDRQPVRREADREPVLIDTTVAHEARVYDYLLGGTVNFAVDRAAAARAAEAVGGIEIARASVRGNRAFLARTVRFLAASGLRQFLDVGTGIPSEGNVHTVARTEAEGTRVVYVDNDPIVLAHAHTLLAGDSAGAVTFIDGDLREPDDILARAAATLDLAAPVAVILCAVLHHFPDSDDPHGLVARLVDGVAPGSYLVASHLASDLHADGMAALADSVPDEARYTFAGRGYEEFARFFTGLDLIGPGIVPIDHWHPPGAEAPTGPSRAWHYGAIGRKR